MTTELPYNPKTMTVMVVDDHDPIRKGIKRVLMSLGFNEVIECFDGDEAIKVIDAKVIDLVISDLYMRNVTGFEFLEHIRNRDVGFDIPVLVVTGEASKEEIVKAADLGADDYILKPFQANDLEKKISKALTKFHSPTPLVKGLHEGDRYYMAGNFAKALEIFNNVLKIDPGSVRAAHGKALSLGKLGRDVEALTLLSETVKKNHSFHKSYGAMADLFIKQNRARDAIEAMRRELEINSKQTTRQIELATLLLKEGDALGAVEHYRIALQEDPKRLNALIGMGHAYAKAEKLDKALYYFKRVRRYHPRATKALEAAVKHALTAKEPRKAELFLRDEKGANPDRHDTYVILAMFYIHTEREDEALTVIEELLAKDPQHAQGLRIKAQIFLRRKDMVKALELLTQLAQVAPSAEALIAKGEAHLSLKQIPQALDTLQQALALNADNPYIYILLAETHRSSQQWLKAHYILKIANHLGANKNESQKLAQICYGEILARRRSRGAA